MNQTELFPLLKAYQSRYGAYTMGDEISDMWLKKFKDAPAAHVVEAFEQLIGSRDKPFGWRVVYDVIEAIHPKESSHIKIEKDWNPDSVKGDDMSKRKIMTDYMTGIMSDNKERARLGQPKSDWLQNYAIKFVEVWGRKQADNQIRSMENQKYTSFEQADNGNEIARSIPLNDEQKGFVRFIKVELQKRVLV